MNIRKFEERDVLDVADLAMRTFQQYNSSDFYNEKAITNTLNYFDTTKNTKQGLLQKFSKKPISYVAEEEGQIVGMINGVANRISSLFVDGSQHRKGIGKALLENYVFEAKECDSDFISIESSIYAAEFYQKMGFVKTTDIVNHMGLKVYKMEKKL